jgi:hypothetical protein
VLLGQALRLILEIQCDVGECGRVLAGVVSAEQELAGGQDHSDVRLSAAAVAAVRCGQGLGRCRVHVSM